MARAAARALLAVALLAACGDDPSFPPLLFDAECASPAEGLSTASTCSANRACDGTLCVRSLDLAPVDGQAATLTCGAPVGATEVGGACAEGASCTTGLCTVSGRCVEACATSSDCAPKRRCQLVAVVVGGALERSAACVPEVVTWPEVAVTELPTVSLQTDGLGGYRAAFPVPSDGATATFGDCTAGLVVPERLSDPVQPEVLYFDRDLRLSLQPIAILSRPVTISFPSVVEAVPPGGAVLSLSAEGPGALRPIHFRRQGSPGGTLDIDLYYVGGGDFAPEGTRGPPAIASALDALETRFVVLRLGTVRQHEVRGDLGARLAVINQERDGTPELAELAGLTAGEVTPSLSIALVRSIQGRLAFAGGLPAAGAMPGTAGSMVALGVDDIGAGNLARTLAHEAGHMFGLFHTTESNGTSVEALDDTPTCPDTFDTNGDLVVSSAECAGQDGGNLMFWSADGDALTAEQFAVVAEHPLLRPD